MKIINKNLFLVYIILVLCSVVLLNLIAKNFFYRLDFTDNKMYSLSESSQLVLNKIDEKLLIKAYFSENLPGDFGNTRRYLQDMLEEYVAFSNGKVHFEFYKDEEKKYDLVRVDNSDGYNRPIPILSSSTIKEIEQYAASNNLVKQQFLTEGVYVDVNGTPYLVQDVETEAQKYGIQPVQLSVIENDQFQRKNVYMGIVFIYEGNREVLPLVSTTTGIEYEITSAIKKLVDNEKKQIGIAQFVNQNYQNQNLKQQLQQTYNIRDISLSSEVPLDIELLILNGLEDSISNIELDNLEQYVIQGGNLFFAQSKVIPNFQTLQGTLVQSNIFNFLNNYGLHVHDNLILDKNCGTVNVQQQVGMFRMQVPTEYPFFPVINHFNQEETMVKDLEQIRLYYPSEITFNDSLYYNQNVRFSSLFETSDYTSTMMDFFNLYPDPKSNPGLLTLNEPKRTIGVKAEVSLSDSAMSKWVFIPDSKFFADDVGAKSPENITFMLNAIDFLAGDEELVKLRSREITSRPLEILNVSTKNLWKTANLILPVLLVILFGIFIWKMNINKSRLIEKSNG